QGKASKLYQRMTALLAAGKYDRSDKIKKQLDRLAARMGWSMGYIASFSRENPESPEQMQKRVDLAVKALNDEEYNLSRHRVSGSPPARIRKSEKQVEDARRWLEQARARFRMNPAELLVMGNPAELVVMGNPGDD